MPNNTHSFVLESVRRRTNAKAMLIERAIATAIRDGYDRRDMELFEYQGVAGRTVLKSNNRDLFFLFKACELGSFLPRGWILQCCYADKQTVVEC